MASTHTHLTLMRGGVVLLAVVAAVCLVVSMKAPIFRLNFPSVKSSITQSMWMTDIYVYSAETHIPATKFVKQCSHLVTAFQVLQLSSIVGIAALALAFLCAVFHMAPAFTGTHRRIRIVCGAPICGLLLIAIAAAGVDCYVTHAMYTKEWCNGSENSGMMDVIVGASPLTVGVSDAAVSAVLHEPGKDLLSSPAATSQRLVVRSLAAETTYSSCDPFQGCITSYQSVGFEAAPGWQMMWAALAVALVALFVELIVITMGGSHVVEAGVGSGAASLLRGDNDEQQRLL